MHRASTSACRVTRRMAAVGALSFVGVRVVSARAVAADALASGAFREEVAGLLRRERPNLRLELAANPLVLLVDGHQTYLVNLYQAAVGATGRAREQGILSFFDAMASGFAASLPPTFEGVQSRLRARIVGAVAAGGVGAVAPLTQPFSPKARIAHVIDSPHATSYVSQRDLERWAVTEGTIRAAGIADLDAISGDVPIKTLPPDQGSGLFSVVAGPDGYAAARLPAPKFVARMGRELGPEYFVAAPCRDALIAWSADCSIKAALAATVAKYASADPYTVTDEIFVSSPGGVRVANPIELVAHGRG